MLISSGASWKYEGFLLSSRNSLFFYRELSFLVLYYAGWSTKQYDIASMSVVTTSDFRSRGSRNHNACQGHLERTLGPEQDRSPQRIYNWLAQNY